MDEPRSAREGLGELERLWAAGAPRVRVHGCEGAFAALTIARLAALPAGANAERPLVVVTPNEEVAANLVRDLHFFMQEHHSALGPRPKAGVASEASVLGPRPKAGVASEASVDDLVAAPRVLHLPHLETAPWADVSPDRRAILRRMATLFRLSQGLAGEVLVASAPGL